MKTTVMRTVLVGVCAVFTIGVRGMDGELIAGEREADKKSSVIQTQLLESPSMRPNRLEDVPEHHGAGLPIALSEAILVHQDTPKQFTLEARDRSGVHSMAAPNLVDTMQFEILSLPRGGTLYDDGSVIDEVPYILSHDRPLYVPNPHFLGADQFEFRAVDSSPVYGPEATIILNVSAFRPPIGIPYPEFGIKEKASVPAEWKAQPTSAKVGSYYIDNTHPQATDANNPFGHPDKPRMSIPNPLNLSPGSVVEIVGGGESYGTNFGFIKVFGNGTKENPIFVRGHSRVNPPTLEWQVIPEGNYQIYENLKLDTRRLDGKSQWFVRGASVGGGLHHIALRHSEVTGKNGQGGVTWADHPNNFPSQLLWWNNLIYDNGDWLAEFDEDDLGIQINKSSHVWILDNEMYHNSGNGVQVNAGTQSELEYMHHIYVGRNVCHHNKQSGIWAKQGNHIVFSQNRCYAARPVYNPQMAPSSYGDGIGSQYAPRNLWILFNEIYDCDYGIRFSTHAGGAHDDDVYIIGNLIYNCRHKLVDATGLYPLVYDPSDYVGPGCGISFWNNAEHTKHIVDNIIANCDRGITYGAPSGEPLVMTGNMFYKIGDGTEFGEHVVLPTSSMARDSVLSYCLFDEPARIRWGTSAVHALESLQATFNQGEYSMEASPVFMDAAAHDYRPQSTSPVVNVGFRSDVYQRFYDLYGLSIDVDHAGLPRPLNGAGEPEGPFGWDIGPFEYVIDGLPYCLDEDVNADGRINGMDTAAVRSGANWGLSADEAANRRADVNRDGTINGLDVAKIRNGEHWGTFPGECQLASGGLEQVNR